MNLRLCVRASVYSCRVCIYYFSETASFLIMNIISILRLLYVNTVFTINCVRAGQGVVVVSASMPSFTA